MVTGRQQGIRGVFGPISLHLGHYESEDIVQIAGTQRIRKRYRFSSKGTHKYESIYNKMIPVCLYMHSLLYQCIDVLNYTLIVR